VKFGVPVPFTTLSGKPEFREDAIGDCRGLREGLNEFLPILSMFLDRTERNSVEAISTKLCWAVQSFVKIGESKITPHLRAQMIFDRCFVHFSSDSDTFRYKTCAHSSVQDMCSQFGTRHVLTVRYKTCAHSSVQDMCSQFCRTFVSFMKISAGKGAY
jgi:hypothetical protein